MKLAVRLAIIFVEVKLCVAKSLDHRNVCIAIVGMINIRGLSAILQPSGLRIISLLNSVCIVVLLIVLVAIV